MIFIYFINPSFSQIRTTFKTGLFGLTRVYCICVFQPNPATDVAEILFYVDEESLKSVSVSWKLLPFSSSASDVHTCGCAGRRWMAIA